MKSAEDGVYSSNRFESRNCDTTENYKNDHPYDKDTSMFGNGTINHRYKN